INTWRRPSTPARYSRGGRKMRGQRRLPAVALAGAAALGFAGVYGFSSPATPSIAGMIGISMGGCDIKGNVSIDTGERIYHVPGQYYYPQTKIRAEYGERYFCSEAEARNAGWRRSMR